MPLLRTVICCAAVFLLLGQRSFAEFQRVGPIDLLARVNGVEVPIALKGTLSVDSSRGDFNANGEITASSSTAKLRDEIIMISATILPFRIPTPRCKLLLKQISALTLGSKDNEAQIEATFRASLEDCTLFLDDPDREVKLKLAVIAAATNGSLLRWRVVRRPEMNIPTTWWGLMRLAKGNPEDYARNSIQHLLDSHASIEIPKSGNIRAALQGAKFDGDKDTLSFLIKGDLHTDGSRMTSIILQLLQTVPLNFTIPHPED
jgi:hypothetical protein